MKKEVQYNPQKAKDLYDALKLISRKPKFANKSLDKIVESVHTAHSKVYNVYRTYKVTSCFFLFMVIFCNVIFGFLFNKVWFSFKVIIITSWILGFILLALLIFYWVYRNKHPVAETYFFKEGNDILKINMYPKNLIYVQKNDAYYRMTPNSCEEISEERFYTDKIIANFIFDFNFIKKLNYRKKRKKRTTVEYYVGKNLSNENTNLLNDIHCGNTFFKSNKYVIFNHTPKLFSLNLYENPAMFREGSGQANYASSVRCDKNEKSFGFEFIIKYYNINNHNIKVVVPEWFYVSCKKNGISLDGFLQDEQPMSNRKDIQIK